MSRRRAGGERRRFWRAAISRQRASGVSVRAFCRQERLAEPSFYAWRKRLARARGIRRTPSGARSTAVGFAAVRVVDDASQPACLPKNTALSKNPIAPCASCVEIMLADGVRVRVPPGVDRKTLADVLAALSADHGVVGVEEPSAC